MEIADVAGNGVGTSADEVTQSRSGTAVSTLPSLI